MPASPIDSAVYGGLFGGTETARLFTDSAEVRAMMLVLGALAKVQGQIGLIPQVSGEAIHRASMELQIDPSALSDGAATSGVPLPALVAAFREAMQAPEHAQFVHWGATSQDILDTALALRLRQALAVFDQRMATICSALAELADVHADLPMAGRTWGQVAVPTSFGALVAEWGRPLLRQHTRLAAIRADVAKVSLSGASGTLGAMGKEGPQVRSALADALGLADPGSSWHSQRDGIAALGGWLSITTGILAKMGEDIAFLAASGIDEVRLSGTGGSSTMPQKTNPVAPNLLVAIARQTTGLNVAIQSALAHRLERDGASWMTEWLSLPQMVQLTSRALAVAGELAGTLKPVPEAMARNLGNGSGLIFAEALTFRLARRMPRPDAAAAVKGLATEVREKGTSLEALARDAYPDTDLTGVFDAGAQMGQAPDEARGFAAAARNTGI